MVGLSERDKDVRTRMADVYRRVNINNETSKDFERDERDCIVFETPMKVTVVPGGSGVKAPSESDRWCTGI